ncbi:MAG: hypothetical protein PHR35_10510 [Kiritimatiellae bacterium]|nr:hypothetical protein [Kiritimatiellia bacterium]
MAVISGAICLLSPAFCVVFWGECARAEPVVTGATVSVTSAGSTNAVEAAIAERRELLTRLRECARGIGEIREHPEKYDPEIGQLRKALQVQEKEATRARAAYEQRLMSIAKLRDLMDEQQRVAKRLNALDAGLRVIGPEAAARARQTATRTAGGATNAPWRSGRRPYPVQGGTGAIEK